LSHIDFYSLSDFFTTASHNFEQTAFFIWHPTFIAIQLKKSGKCVHTNQDFNRISWKWKSHQFCWHL